MTLLRCPPEQHSTYQIIRQLDIDILHKDVLFAGSHDLIEKDLFQRCGVNKVICFECNPHVFCDLEERLVGTTWSAFNVCLWDQIGVEKEFYFYRQKRDGASSLFLPDKMGDYVDCPPTGESIKLKTTTLDHYIQNKIIDLTNVNLAIFDLQGAELNALRGSKELLGKVEWLIIETSSFECYKNAPIEYEITSYVASYGYEKIAFQKDWGIAGNEHGDTIYRRK